MKKLLLSTIILAAGLTQASAQEANRPYLLTEVEENTFAVTLTQEEIAAAYPADWVSAAYNIGAAAPAGTVLGENANVTITAATVTPVYTANGKLSDIQKDFPSYTGYINLGSSLGQNNWTGDETIIDVAASYVSGHGIVSVTPKKDGVLKFGVYAGDNSRAIGIYRMATEEEMNNDDLGGWVSYNNFRNDGTEGTVLNAPAYVEGEVLAGHEYLLIGGSNKNLTLHQISFVPSKTDERPNLLTEVEPNVFAVTLTQEEIAAAYPADWVSAAYNIGAAAPAGTVLGENANVTITAATVTPVYTANGKLSDIQKDFPSYTGYINLGSSLGQNNWTGDETIIDVAASYVSGHGIVGVTPKKDGVLKFGVYAGDNSRAIGIYRMATEEEMDNDDLGGWVSYNNFRNDGTEGTVLNAPAYVEGNVLAGREYLLIGGSNKNLTLHQITFVPGDGASISNIGISDAANKTVEAYYTLDGVRVSAPVQGISIVKYSDGTAKKVIRK